MTVQDRWLAQDACALVTSQIHHTRHAPKPHFLARPGLSLLIDITKLDKANSISRFFSVGRFNILSFTEQDYGCFHKSYDKPHSYDSLSDYIKALASASGVTTPISRIELLTFPRIFGVSFNPLSVYRCLDAADQMVFVVYEVHNTFGESHSYVGRCDDTGRASLHEAEKCFHVSPFFDVTGDYQLFHRQAGSLYNLIIRYRIKGALALTATMRGTITPLTSWSIIKNLIKTRQWPLRPWFAIHLEALKLFAKRLTFISKPPPPSQPHSLSSLKGQR